MVTAGTLFSLLTALFVALCFVEPYLLIVMKSEAANILYLFYAGIKYLVIGCFAVSLITLKRLPRDRGAKLSALLGALFVAYALLGLASGNGALHLAYSLKYVYSWLFLLVIFYLSPAVSAQTVALAFRVSVLAAMVNFAYSLVFDLFVFHRLQDIYFYDLYSRLGMFSEWNVIRDGKLRYSGLMGSNLALSQILLLPISFLLSSVWLERGGARRLAALVLLGLLLVFLYKTSARNPVLSLAASLAFLVLNVRFRMKAMARTALFVLFYLVSFSFVIVLNALELGDPSSVRRILLLYEFWQSFSANPLGYGIGAAGISIPGYKFFYESALTTLFTDAGVFGICFLLPVFAVYYRALDLVHRTTDESGRPARLIACAVAIMAGSLLFMTNFSNIFDNSLYLFSLVLGCYWKADGAPSGELRHA